MENSNGIGFVFDFVLLFFSADRNAVLNPDNSEEAQRQETVAAAAAAAVATTHPVQRRESSASRFLKHFRPDRNNPAYHSEGKGLRKRRQPWSSERELADTSDHPDPSTEFSFSSIRVIRCNSAVVFPRYGIDER